MSVYNDYMACAIPTYTSVVANIDNEHASVGTAGERGLTPPAGAGKPAALLQLKSQLVQKSV